MTPRLALGLWLLLALAVPALPAHASDADPAAALCERAIVAGARLSAALRREETDAPRPETPPRADAGAPGG